MEKKNITDPRPSLVIEPKIIHSKGEKKVLEYNSQIQTFISKLDENMSIVIKGHEADFLSAYKTIMTQIQIQMSKLRQNSDEQTIMVKNDTAVQGLQENLAWYQNEAVRLSDACSRLQSRYDKVREKIQNFTIENAYLEQQIKMLIRQNQTLKKNLNKEETPQINEISQGNQENFEISETILRLTSNFKVKNKLLLVTLQDFLEKIEKKNEEMVKNIDFEIKSMKEKIKEISAVQSGLFLQRNELEELFLECVDEMRKEIIRKKAKAQSIKRAGTVKYESHLITEREKLIESFVTNEETISFLYDKLFPRKNEKFGKKDLDFGMGGARIKNDSHEKKSSNDSRFSSMPKKGIVVKGKLLINQ